MYTDFYFHNKHFHVFFVMVVEGYFGDLWKKNKLSTYAE